MDEITNFRDFICNIKEAMKVYFYPKEDADNIFALRNHTHPIDDNLNDSSTNPVQNKVIKSALDNKAPNELATETKNGLMSKIDFNKLSNIEENATHNEIDSTIKSDGVNPVKGSAIYTALEGKAPNNLSNSSRDGLMSMSDYNKLYHIQAEANKTVVDGSLNDSSTNPVQNKVINTALAGKADKNTIATISNNGLMSSDYVNILTNLQQAVMELHTEFDKNDLRILFLRYKNGVWEGEGGTQLVVDPGDYVYLQIDCTDPRYNKKDKTVRLFINGVVYDYTTDVNGRTKTGKIISSTLPKGNYVISAFMDGVDNKNPVVDHKILVVK